MPRPRRSELFGKDAVGVHTSACDRIHAVGSARRNESRNPSPAGKSTRGDLSGLRSRCRPTRRNRKRPRGAAR